MSQVSGFCCMGLPAIQSMSHGQKILARGLCGGSYSCFHKLRVLFVATISGVWDPH